jgi:hypothetical protein
VEPRSNATLRTEWELVKERVGKKGKIRSNQNLAYAGIITFGTKAQRIFESLDAEAQDAAYREVAMAVAKKLDTRLLGLVVHADETAPHAHFQMRGISNDGSMLSAKVKRGMLREIQTITAEIMARHAPGIERGKDKWQRIEEGEKYADTVNRKVRRLHDDLTPEIEAKEARLVELNTEVSTHERRAAKSRAKAEDSEARAAKALKNADTYDRRAQKARDKIAKIKSELIRLRAVHDRTVEENQKLAETGEKLVVANRIKDEERRSLEEALSQKKTEVASLKRKKDALQKRLTPLNAA